MNILNYIKKDSDVKILFLFYLLSFWLILFNLDFIYFDDWTLVNQSKYDLINIFGEVGNPLTGYLHYFLIEYLGIYSYKILTFIVYFIAGVMLNKILKELDFLTISERIFIVLVFLLLPVNFARIALIDFFYGFYYMFFFIAFFLLSKYINTKKIEFRILSLLFFFISFQVNSLLVFYLIVFIYSLYVLFDNSLKKYFTNMIKLFDFWVLPFLFFIFKSIYLVPKGLHTTYYAITKEKLLNSFISSLDIFKRFYNELYILIPEHISLTSIIILFFIIFIILKKCSVEKYDFSFHLIFKKIVFILIGIAFSYIAIYPYMVVNTSPSFFDWDSRHMLLLSLGISLFSLVIYYIVSFSKYLRIVTFSLIISFFISMNNSVYYSYIIDGIKQDSIINYIAEKKSIKNNNSFLIYDDIKEYDALKRTYRFYEYGGMLDLIYGGQDKFATQYDSTISDLVLKNYISPSLKLKNYVIEKKFIKIYIKKGTLELNSLNVISLIFFKLFKREQYKEMLNQVLVFKVSAS